jgi:hypothetical protein
MSYLQGVAFGKGHQFTNEEFLLATPDSVSRWMKLKAFGTVDVTPTSVAICRSTTLEMCKKAISFYMPHRNAFWNTETNFGNPTKSKEVNDLIKHLRNKEVKKLGACASKAKRALTQAEFRAAVSLLSRSSSFQAAVRTTCMMRFQYHLIMRSDDIGHFKIEHLKGHTTEDFKDFALELRVFWTKNVLEERDCPDQILLGSMDHQYCMLLSLSLYLEQWFSNGNGLNLVFLFSEDNDEELGPIRTKNRYSFFLRNNVFLNEEFQSQTGMNASGKLGTHSLRKFPATWASRNDCNADDIDVRGRWKKNTQRIVNTYIDPKQQYMDAKVQAALCIGGPIRYKLVEGTGITSNWLHNVVVPGICNKYNYNSVCDVLVLPLLFACFDINLSNMVPDNILCRVKEGYASLANEMPPGTNPVQRILLNIYKIGETLHIDEMIDCNNVIEDVNTGSNIITNTRSNNNQNNNNSERYGNLLNSIMVQNMQLKQQMLTQHDDVINNLNLYKSDMEKKVNVINRNIQRIYVQPSRMATPQQCQANMTAENAATAAEEIELLQQARRVELSKQPKSLHELWQEFQFGINNQKAAKDFTTAERGGKNKFKYCRRKVFWDLIALHVQAGFLAQVAIDRVYDCYGRRLSVTAILELMRKDKTTGGHPNLRIN